MNSLMSEMPGPLVGARKPARIAEAVAAVENPLSADVLAAVDRSVPRSACSSTGVENKIVWPLAYAPAGRTSQTIAPSYNFV